MKQKGHTRQITLQTKHYDNHSYEIHVRIMTFHRQFQR